MSKSALIGFTKGLARDLGARRITVNVIQPGPIDTEGNPADGGSAAFIASLTALGTFGKTVDVGNAAAFLASDEASFITGSAVTIDGGFSA